ncbi:uncharacterized protein BJX67DRAFT_380719 [Aspergillus lucknowensis]|uniref:Uncharacterized protein n=1 Tax=Aspergillus lucknowensis TaxID=176173 RepID=A0ABR4LTD9_9EURO
MAEQLSAQLDRLRLASSNPTAKLAQPNPRWKSPRIKTITPCGLEIPGVGAGTDFKLYPGGGRFWDWSETQTKLETGIQVADVEELVQNGATTVVISRGRKNELQIQTEALRYLAERDITVLIANTRRAVELYCALVDTTPVGALFVFYPGQEKRSRTSKYIEEHDL